MFADFTGLASMAVATALNVGQGAYHALRLLELGCGVIVGQLMEMRGDISDLKQQHPDLGAEFTSLRDELRAPVDRTTSPISTDNTPSWESQAKRHREAYLKFSELINQVACSKQLTRLCNSCTPLDDTEKSKGRLEATDDTSK
ncbi:hypothetical protein NW767_014057 [Fusarium falciforme]|nr:hypothetical protein NW767_014057 [Fusarium falciforme]